MRHEIKVIHMSRTLTAGAIGIVFASVSWAAEDSPPPLSAPALTAPAATATEEPKQPAAEPPAARIPESRPVLVVPGVTAPGRARSQPTIAASPTPQPAPAEEFPKFEIPQEMLEPKPREIPRRAGTTATGPIPRVVESIPRSADGGDSPALRARPELTPRSPVVRPVPRTADAAAARETEPVRRPPGLFGRFFPPPPRSATAERSNVTVEPRVDPAADAALQRRVERQLRDAVGDRVRFYEVRVVDRNVNVRVRVTRFWQKRSVRSTIESLPALSGYHARVELVD